jgi:hypothetical protein
VVSAYSWDGQLLDAVFIATCGYSLVPMMAVMAIGVAICVGLLAWAFWARLPGAGLMPCAGSCSAAISAACHAPRVSSFGEDGGVGVGVGAEGRELMWGVVRSGGIGVGEGEAEVIGVCGFSGGPVDALVEGKRYG